MKKSNILYQHFGACFRLYRDLVNLQTKFSFLCSSKPSGWSMYISSSSSPWRRVVYTSNCSRCKSNVAHIVSIILIVVSLTTGKNISLKSMPSFLTLSFYQLSCTIPCHLIVTISFDLIDLFVTNGFLTLWKFKKFPCLDPMQSFHFFLHCCHPQRNI